MGVSHSARNSSTWLQIAGLQWRADVPQQALGNSLLKVVHFLSILCWATQLTSTAVVFGSAAVARWTLFLGWTSRNLWAWDWKIYPTQFEFCSEKNHEEPWEYSSQLVRVQPRSFRSMDGQTFTVRCVVGCTMHHQQIWCTIKKVTNAIVDEQRVTYNVHILKSPAITHTIVTN